MCYWNNWTSTDKLLNVVQKKCDAHEISSTLCSGTFNQVFLSIPASKLKY